MANIIEMQTVNCSNLDQSRLCSLDLEVIESPTMPLIHQSARFLFINRGKGTIKIQNIECELKENSLVSILPWEISEVTAVEEPLQYYLLVYKFDILNQAIKSFYNVDPELLKVITDMPKLRVASCNSAQAEKIRNIILSIRDEVGIESSMKLIPSKPLSGVYLTSLLAELIVHFLRIGNENYPEGERVSNDRSEIFRYMYTHLNEKLTLKLLAQIFYMSESSISTYITQVTGLSFFDLLNEMRVGKTINYLLYTDFTLEELAEIMGYVDASHISKVFAARIGMKVNEYRRTYQKINNICDIGKSRQSYAIVSYIYRNYQERLTAKTLAEQFSISVNDLHLILLQQVEKNFEDFLNFVRVNRACELLLKTNKSIIDIAVEVGYNTTKTLNRNFLKLKMMTPSKLRESVAFQENNLI